MNKIIETQAELENKLSEIRRAAQKAQAEKKFFRDTFFAVSSLVPSLPSLEHEQYGYSFPSSSSDSPLFRGLDTVVVANIECMADFSQSARRTLTFERKGRDIRCFYAGGLYLYYPYVYREKTHCLASLAYGDLCRKYGTSRRPSLTEPNKIGVITAKKLQSWVNYFEELVALCKKAEAENDAMLTEFRDKLRTVCPDKADLDKGFVEINGIRFTWKIRQDGYIHTECNLTYEYSYGIDNFIKLINMNK